MKFLVLVLAALVLVGLVAYFFVSPAVRQGILDLLTAPSSTKASPVNSSTSASPPSPKQVPPGFIGPQGPPGVIGPPGPPPNY